MKNTRQAPEVNAGSMADIAFLLLIFFLVTAVIPNDTGINRKLPKLCPPGQTCDAEIKEKNILRIALNANQEIMVEDDLVTIDQIKPLSIAFLDNNGDKSCNYCNGLGILDSSDNPSKAVISLMVDDQTNYNLFIQVQDELTKAYYELRSKYAKQKFGKLPSELDSEELMQVRVAYPFIVSEASTN
jgi:biopolymer transport protein ExbD